MKKSDTISDIEFRRILKCQKFFVEKSISFPSNGEKAHFQLYDIDQRNNYSLDINRSGVIELNKFTLQNRYLAIPLVRLDIDAPPHINPDGGIIPRNHIHIYREGFGDAWAYKLDNLEDFSFFECTTFDDYVTKFCEGCNITIPEVQSVI